MRIIEWSEPSHAVHVPEVDDEHQAIFSHCADLRRALEADAPIDDVRTIVAELVIHTAHHFTHEEREMRATGYTHYDWHRRLHQTARSRVRVLERRIRRGERDAAVELLNFVGPWLNDHVRLADRMLGAYLRNHQRAESARAIAATTGSR